MTTVPSSDILDRFTAIVGDRNAVRDAAEMAPRLVENRGLYRGASPLLLKPGSVEEVSAILKFASETGTPIVPQTGNTGLVGGAVLHGGIGLSLRRMNRILSISSEDSPMVIEAAI